MNVHVCCVCCRDRYTLAELSVRPLPEGVDPSKMEIYLSDDEFKVCIPFPAYFLCSIQIANGIGITTSPSCLWDKSEIGWHGMRWDKIG